MTDSLTISIAEAARILGISERTAYRLVHESRFPVRVITVGSRAKVSRRQLTEYIDGPAAPEQAAS